MKRLFLLLFGILAACDEGEGNIRKFFPYFREAFKTCTDAIVDGDHLDVIDSQLAEYQNEITREISQGKTEIKLPNGVVLDVRPGNLIFDSSELRYRYSSGPKTAKIGDWDYSSYFYEAELVGRFHYQAVLGHHTGVTPGLDELDYEQSYSCTVTTESGTFSFEIDRNFPRDDLMITRIVARLGDGRVFISTTKDQSGGDEEDGTTICYRGECESENITPTSEIYGGYYENARLTVPFPPNSEQSWDDFLSSELMSKFMQLAAQKK